jgi:predicted transcriptional regulator
MPHFKQACKRHIAEMWRDVLETISKGVFRPTNIMNKTNLDYTNAQDILNKMRECGLVVNEANGTRSCWTITPKGREALKRLTEAFALVRNE